MSWFENLIPPKKKPNEPQNLTDIVRGLQYAVNSAIHATENQYISTLNRFFTKKKDSDTYVPKKVSVEIDENHCTEIPLIALINPNGVSLKKMKVDLSIKVDATSLKTIPKEDEDQDSIFTRSCFNVSFSNKKMKGDHMQISMEFETKDQPEGISRVLEFYTNKIQPSKME